MSIMGRPAFIEKEAESLMSRMDSFIATSAQARDYAGQLSSSRLQREEESLRSSLSDFIRSNVGQVIDNAFGDLSRSDLELLKHRVSELDTFVAAEFLFAAMNVGGTQELASREFLSSMGRLDNLVATALLYEIRLTGNVSALTDQRIFSCRAAEFFNSLGAEASSEWFYSIGNTGNVSDLTSPAATGDDVINAIKQNARVAGELSYAIGTTGRLEKLTGSRFIGFLGSLDSDTAAEYLSAIWCTQRVDEMSGADVMARIVNGKEEVWRDVVRSFASDGTSAPKIIITNAEGGDHDRGVKLVVHSLINSGFNVIYADDASADELISTAINENVAAIGFSISGEEAGRKAAAVMESASAMGLSDVSFFAGGIINPKLAGMLEQRGARLFMPGSNPGDLADFLRISAANQFAVSLMGKGADAYVPPSMYPQTSHSHAALPGSGQTVHMPYSSILEHIMRTSNSQAPPSWFTGQIIYAMQALGMLDGSGNVGAYNTAHVIASGRQRNLVLPVMQPANQQPKAHKLEKINLQSSKYSLRIASIKDAVQQSASPIPVKASYVRENAVKLHAMQDRRIQAAHISEAAKRVQNTLAVLASDRRQHANISASPPARLAARVTRQWHTNAATAIFALPASSIGAIQSNPIQSISIHPAISASLAERASLSMHLVIHARNPVLQQEAGPPEPSRKLPIQVTMPAIAYNSRKQNQIDRGILSYLSWIPESKAAVHMQSMHQPALQTAPDYSKAFGRQIAISFVAMDKINPVRYVSDANIHMHIQVASRTESPYQISYPKSSMQELTAALPELLHHIGLHSTASKSRLERAIPSAINSSSAAISSNPLTAGNVGSANAVLARIRANAAKDNHRRTQVSYDLPRTNVQIAGISSYADPISRVSVVMTRDRTMRQGSLTYRHAPAHIEVKATMRPKRTVIAVRELQEPKALQKTDANGKQKPNYVYNAIETRARPVPVLSNVSSKDHVKRADLHPIEITSIELHTSAKAHTGIMLHSSAIWRRSTANTAAQKSNATTKMQTLQDPVINIVHAAGTALSQRRQHASYINIAKPEEVCMKTSAARALGIAESRANASGQRFYQTSKMSYKIRADKGIASYVRENSAMPNAHPQAGKVHVGVRQSHYSSIALPSGVSPSAAALTLSKTNASGTAIIDNSCITSSSTGKSARIAGAKTKAVSDIGNDVGYDSAEIIYRSAGMVKIFPMPVSDAYLAKVLSARLGYAAHPEHTEQSSRTETEPVKERLAYQSGSQLILQAERPTAAPDTIFAGEKIDIQSVHGIGEQHDGYRPVDMPAAASKAVVSVSTIGFSEDHGESISSLFRINTPELMQDLAQTPAVYTSSKMAQLQGRARRKGSLGRAIRSVLSLVLMR